MNVAYKTDQTDQGYFGAHFTSAELLFSSNYTKQPVFHQIMNYYQTLGCEITLHTDKAVYDII